MWCAMNLNSKVQEKYYFPKRESEKKVVSSGGEAFSYLLFEFCVVDWCIPYFELVLCWHV